jgi:pyridoxine/pyridoxamine 5'-phosphate oxidase
VRNDVTAPDPSETFDVAGADPDPFDRFERWWAHARLAVPDGDADAMVVATASAGGKPSSHAPSAALAKQFLDSPFSPATSPSRAFLLPRS